MAHDLISDARRLAQALDSDGLTGRSRGIEDVIAGGATGSEILMGLRWHVREVLDADRASAATRRQAELLLRQISRALDPR